MKIIKEIVKFFIPNDIWKSLKLYYLLKHSDVISIIYNPDNFFKRLYHIKDDTWEHMQIPAIYKTMLPCELSCFHAEQNVLLIPNATICNNSDMILTSSGMVWDKAQRQDFSKIIPLDRNFLKHEDDRVFIMRHKTQDINGLCLSMLGVHADLWAHFLVQFLPKLYYAEECDLLNNKITILLPKYRDKNVVEMINMVLDKHSTVIRLEVEDNIEYRCENLMYMPTASVVANHSFFSSPFDIVIPSCVIARIQSNVVEPFINKVTNKSQQYDKIYLPRTNASYRNTSNILEIDNYFRSQGFHFVEGSKMTLEEKADVFSHAKIIAGPLSSAWINTIFCRGAKGLLLTNVPKSIDSYCLSVAGAQNIKIMHVLGEDLGNDLQTDFYMPLDRVMEAYNQLLND